MRPSIVLLITLLLAGCSTGPRYANLRTPGAATLAENPESPIVAEIQMIDGAIAPKTPLYLTPGFHRLSIWLTCGGSNASPDVDVTVEANRSYRLDVLAGRAPTLEIASLALRIVDMESGKIVCFHRLSLHRVGPSLSSAYY
jgi:hypothetical protein